MSYYCDTNTHYTYSYDLFYDTQTCDKCPLFLNRDRFTKYDDNGVGGFLLFAIAFCLIAACFKGHTINPTKSEPMNPTTTYTTYTYTENYNTKALEMRVEKVEQQLTTRIQTLEKQLNDLEEHVMLYCVESD